MTITPFLWFDSNAEAAITRYLSVFPDAEQLNEARNPDGSLFIGTIRIAGQELSLMNGGPSHQLSEAFSLSVSVDTQEEIDRLSDELIAGGGALSRCGWLRDPFGLSWQIVPANIVDLLYPAGDPAAAARAQRALLGMDKIDIQALVDAEAGMTSPR